MHAQIHHNVYIIIAIDRRDVVVEEKIVELSEKDTIVGRVKGLQ